MRFTNILLVLDSGVGNSFALERALRLARIENAKPTVCDVVESIPGDYRRLITAITPRELTATVVADRHENIEVLLASVDRKGVTIDTRILTGKAHIEIAELVRTHGYDLVIKPIVSQRATRNRTIARRHRELMRHCPCPVWLVNVADLSEDSCVIAALDMPGDGEISTRLNEEILKISRSIALATFRPLHIVHAWTLSGEGHLRARGTTDSNREVDAMVAREATNRMAWLRAAVFTTRSDSEEIATDYLAPKLHTLKGETSTVLPDIAEQLRAGLIVMGTAARTGLPGLLIGNTSEALVHRSDSSLLIVREPEAPQTHVAGHRELSGTADFDRAGL